MLRAARSAAARRLKVGFGISILRPNASPNAKIAAPRSGQK
jgi:hypothetical protein